MKKVAVILACVALLALGAPAIAEICTIDDVPAATLLLPYFEVNLDDPNGITTLFSVNNASATAVLAHVVVWSDLSVPVLDFNIYLTGYDVQSVNLRDLLVGGILPRTASDGQDPADTISPQGDFSQDINFASCNGQLPPPLLPASFIAHLQHSLTGQFSADPERLRRLRLRRPDRPRLRDDRHGQQLHPALPWRCGLLRGRRRR